MSVEVVCRRWKSIVAEYLWPRVLCIDRAAIGYPYTDFANNFIQIAARVHRVSEWVDVLGLLRDDRRLHALMESELRKSIRELVDKRMPESIFPFDVIKHVLICDGEGERKRVQHTSSFKVGCDAEELFQAYQVDQFAAIRVERLFARLKNAELDPFTVTTKGREIYFPLSKTKFTRLHIGCLVIQLFNCRWIDKPLWKQARRVLHEIGSLSRLEMIELESCRLQMFSSWEGKRCEFDLTFSFHPHRCQLKQEEFMRVLERMSERDERIPNEHVVELVEEWANKAWIRDVEIHISGEQLKNVLHKRKNPPAHPNYVEDQTTVNLLRHLFPSLTKSLHLAISSCPETAEYLLSSFVEDKLMSHLSELDVSLPDQPAQNGDGTPNVTDKVLCTLAAHLGNLTTLQLGFLAARATCLSTSMARVVQPLPHLQKLVCNNVTCLALLSSIIQQAPNLQHLAVELQTFPEERKQLELINKLLAALAHCSDLLFLAVKVTEPIPNLMPAAKRPRATTPPVPIDHHYEILDEMESLVESLKCTLPRLLRIVIIVKSLRFNWIR